MKKIILITVGSLVLCTVNTLAAEKNMDGISKQIYTVCNGKENMDTEIFMWGIASGIRFTQLTYSKGKDKFDVQDHIAVDMACRRALNDKSNNRFSSKFKNALVVMFNH